MKTNWLLAGIIFLSLLLRLWNLGNNPPHLTPDEASLGYNAYSILKTGRDEYGKFMPLVFKSFGDYKPGLYVYLTVPSVLVFGLTEFAVRVPSAIFGVISVYLIYLITKKLFDERLGLISAFVSSITPWLIYFSRGAWEANVALTLTLAGIYFFLKSLKENKYLAPSAVAFALTLIAYQGSKLSTIIVLALLLITHWKDFWKIEKKKIVSSFLVGLVIALPIISGIFSGQAGRLEVFSVFSYKRPSDYLQAFLDQDDEIVGTSSYYLNHSEVVNTLRGIMGRYFNHFSGRFLFFEGDWTNPRHTAPNSGMFLLSDIIILLVGMVVVVNRKINRSHLFVLMWLIIAPLPAVLSRDQVHAIRSLNLVVPLVIISSFGINYLYNQAVKLKRKKLRIPVLLLFASIQVASVLYFLDSYFVHLPNHDSKLWEYGYKQIVETVVPIQGNYKKIKVQQSFSQPYIYFLFYGQKLSPETFDPSAYQKISQLTVADSVKDVGYVLKLGNIEFSPIDWSVNRGDSGTLFVADTVRIPPEDSKDENEFKIISEIKYLNGRDTAFRIVEVK